MTRGWQGLSSGEESPARQGIEVSPPLTVQPDKRLAYGRDTYFIESVEQLAELTDDVAGFAHTCSILLLKPEAVVTRQIVPAVDWLVTNGFRIVAAEPVLLTRTMIRALWYFQWNLATAQRRRLADLLVAMGESLVLVVRRESRPGVEPTSVQLTALKGPADPRARTPGQLRSLLGRHSYLLNVAHTPDEPADVVRELGIYFDHSRRAEVYAAALADRDRSAQARDHAERLYAGTPARDLDFPSALHRLRVAASRHPSLDPTAPPGELLTDAWRLRVELDPWDVLTVGSSVLPMRRDGWVPVLDGCSAEAWRAHLAERLTAIAPLD